MLFKNLMLYRYNATWKPDVQVMQEALERNCFTACSATQAQSIGWVCPRGVDNGSMVEFVNGQWLLRLMIEDKPVPAAIVKRRVEELCQNIERETGRKPGKKYQAELKEDVLLELLPMAFPRQREVNVWINPKHHWIMMDVTTASVAGIVATALVKTFEGLAVNDVQTKFSPSAAMMDWLLENAPAAWTLDMDCELRTDGDKKSVVRYSGLPLDTPEIRAYIEQGMMPTQVAMTWSSRVSVVLTHELKLKRISLLDVVFESNPNDGDDVYDADVAIATGELLPLMESLISALGGEQQGVV